MRAQVQVHALDAVGTCALYPMEVLRDQGTLQGQCIRADLLGSCKDQGVDQRAQRPLVPPSGTQCHHLFTDPVHGIGHPHTVLFVTHIRGQFIHLIAAACGDGSRPQLCRYALDARDHRGGRNAQHPAGAAYAATLARERDDQPIGGRGIGLVAIVAALVSATCSASEQLHQAMPAFSLARALAMPAGEGDAE